MKASYSVCTGLGSLPPTVVVVASIEVVIDVWSRKQGKIPVTCRSLAPATRQLPYY